MSKHDHMQDGFSSEPLEPLYKPPAEPEHNWQGLRQIIIDQKHDIEDLRRQLARFRGFAKMMAMDEEECGCEHRTKDCCVKQGVFCHRCLAAKCLREKK